MNRCTVCNVDMGSHNPRQLCGKTYCMNDPKSEEESKSEEQTEEQTEDQSEDQSVVIGSCGGARAVDILIFITKLSARIGYYDIYAITKMLDDKGVKMEICLDRLLSPAITEQKMKKYGKQLRSK